jgi:hypothetical protein
MAQVDVARSFALLGVAYDASREEIRRAYRRQVLAWHPDHFPAGSSEQAEAQRRLTELNAAFSLIKSGRVRPHAGSDPHRPSSRAAAGRQVSRARGTDAARRSAALGRREAVQRTAQRLHEQALGLRKAAGRAYGPSASTLVGSTLAGSGALPLSRFGSAGVLAALGLGAAGVTASVWLGARARRRTASPLSALRIEELRCPHCGSHPVTSLLASPRRLDHVARTARCPDCDRAYWLR